MPDDDPGIGVEAREGQIVVVAVAQDVERVVFSWIAWPDKETRDAGWAKMMGDERMAGPMPFDGARMVYGGFRPVVEL